MRGAGKAAPARSSSAGAAADLRRKRAAGQKAVRYFSSKIANVLRGFGRSKRHIPCSDFFKSQSALILLPPFSNRTRRAGLRFGFSYLLFSYIFS